MQKAIPRNPHYRSLLNAPDPLVFVGPYEYWISFEMVETIRRNRAIHLESNFPHLER